MTAEANEIRPGASVDEATAILNQSEYVTGDDAYLAWLQDRHDWAIEQLNGVHFDIPAPLRRIEVVLARDSTSGAAYYTGPSEDLTRPGRTWWPLGGRDPHGPFETWSELSTVFHEGVPGHHLQVGAAKTAGDQLSRFAKIQLRQRARRGLGPVRRAARRRARLVHRAGHPPGHARRIGAARRAGGHRHRRPPGPAAAGRLPVDLRASRARCCARRGRGEPHRIQAEVVRYFGWPGQAISYKLGERAWLAARADAMRRPGFDLKRWHTAALSLGPIGLAALADTLAGAG